MDLRAESTGGPSVEYILELVFGYIDKQWADYRVRLNELAICTGGYMICWVIEGIYSIQQVVCLKSN